MKNLSGALGVAVFGMVSFAVTVIFVIALERLTGFNLVTFSTWGVAPIGAVITGCAAASGYYFGSLFFHTRPTWILLIQILLVATAAQLAIYYGEYATLALDDRTRVASFTGFWDYFDSYIKSTHLRVGLTRADTGEIGNFGYLVAGIRFVGFLAGGVLVFLPLRNSPTCETCGRYLRTLIHKSQRFSTQSDFTQYYDTLFQHPFHSRAFAESMRRETQVGHSKKGTTAADSTLRLCPHCKTQTLSQEVKVLGHTEWKVVPQLTRHVRIPDGIDLQPVFRDA
jgi:hypothetical protein